MLRRLAVLLALCFGMVSGPGLALGLGAIRVESGLNQPFAATIPFTSLSAQEAENLRVRIADNEDFARAGIDRSAYLSSITVEAVTDPPSPRLVIRSQKSAREPLLTLLIDVRAGGPRMLREYTVFLDPPSAEAAAGETKSPSDSEAATVPKTPAAKTEAPAASTPPSQYGPIRSGEVLWKIAEQLRPKDGSVSLDQAVLALYRANPEAFLDGNIDSLVRGVVMRVPSQAEMRAIKPDAATESVRALSATPREPEQTPGAEIPSSVSEGKPAEVVPTESEPAQPGGEADEGEEEGGGEVEAQDSDSEAPAAEAAEPATAEEAKPEPPPVPADKPATAPKLPVTGTTSGSDAGEILAKMVPALVVVILLLVGVLVWRSVRQKRAQAEYEAAAHAMATATVAAAGQAPVPRGPRSVREELEEVNRKLAEEDGKPSTDDVLLDTVKQAAPVAAVEPELPAASARSASGFDATSALQASTFEIDLSGNDPISEAEFHHAYGLYDEAALLLKQAVEKEPERNDLRVKLAETYFAAGKATEFEETADSLVSRLDRPSWEKIAIMGRQLCPDAELFKGGYSGSSMNIDLALDGTDAGEPAVPSTRIDDGLDFKLEELELPAGPAGQTVAKTSRPLTDFDLGEFDLGGVKLDTKLDTGAAAADLELKLDEFTADVTADDPFSEEVISAGDDVGTKLDLARAYVEMGDLEMARSLLDEVDVQGSDDQKRESSQLRGRMLG